MMTRRPASQLHAREAGFYANGLRDTEKMADEDGVSPPTSIMKRATMRPISQP